MDMPEQPASAPIKGKTSRNEQPAHDGTQKAKAGKNENEQPRKARVDAFATGHDFLIINSPMDGDLFLAVVQAINESKKNKKLVVFLVSWGGLADAAYRTGRYLQSTYDQITVFIPSSCKSAGTLLAIAGNSIIMSPFGELGPLDVQLRKRDEIFGRRSGLITRAAISDLQEHAFDLFESFMLKIINNSYGNVSLKVAADISARVSGEIMSKIYEQIHPDSLGQDFRDLSVATKYCERLAKWSKNISDSGIKRLVHDYPSHDFVIDSEEAKEIFQKVDLPTPTLVRLLRENLDCLLEPRENGDVVIKLIDRDGVDGKSGSVQSQPSNISGEPRTNGRDAGPAASTP